MGVFWDQFLGAITGGLLAIVGVFVAFFLERKARTRESFEQSVEQLMYRINDLANAADAWDKQRAVSSWAPGDFPPPHPHPGSVSIAIEIALLKAEKQSDQDALDDVSAAWNDVAQFTGATLSTACGVMANAVVAWRRGAGASEVRSTLNFARRLPPIEEQGL